MIKIYHQKQTRYPEINEFPADFEFIAVLDTSDFDKAWEKTQHILSDWTKEPGVTRAEYDKKVRSSMVGDVFVRCEHLKDKPASFVFAQVDTCGMKTFSLQKAKAVS